jgi:hypothetical protein
LAFETAVFAVFAVLVDALTFELAAVLASVVTLLLAVVLAFASAVFALASVLALAFCSVVIAPPVVSKTERVPVTNGWDNKKANNMNAKAAPIVIFAKIVCVPRGPKALLETLLVNKAPASDLPGCNKTEVIKTTQDKRNNVYNT